MSKTFFTVFSILVLSVCGQPLTINDPAIQEEPSASTGASFSDDFNRADSDSLGAAWDEVDTDVDIASQKLSLSDTFDNTQQFAVYTNTACTTANQYIKTTVTSGGVGCRPTVYFRFTDSSSAYYEIFFDIANTDIVWRHWTAVGGTSSEVERIDYTFVAGTLGYTITGTGNSTVIRFWASVTANAPDSGGATWDSAAATITFTADPASAVNTGSYVGLGGENVFGGVTHDDFYGGDIP